MYLFLGNKLFNLASSYLFVISIRIGFLIISFSSNSTIETPSISLINFDNQGRATNSFLISDYSAPIISNILKTTSNPLDTDPAFGWINITCKVVDNVAVSQVYLNITNPSGSFNNLSMIPYGSNYYYSNTSGTFSQHGNYTYLIWSIDNDSNTVSSTIYTLSLPQNYDINMDGTQNLLDLVMISNVYGNTGFYGWIREDVDNNGIIQILDMVQISNHYAQSWWL